MTLCSRMRSPRAKRSKASAERSSVVFPSTMSSATASPAAGVLLLVVIIRGGRSPQYLALAALLIALAVGVWYTAIRTPPALP